jgi:3-hydroxyisobutyrate dehydrogenase-like beta-hydroxyacid dehydrogenase
MKKIGFIGLGVMGYPIAEHLLDKHTLYIYNRSNNSYATLQERGAVVCADPMEVAHNSQYIFLCLPTHKDVENILFGEQGLLAAHLQGKYILDLSTINLSKSKKIASHLKGEGVYYFDCPISGGPKGAKNANLSIMVGGDAKQYESISGLLHLFGSPVYCGENGAGLAAKIANNLIVATTTAVISEAMCLAAKSGVAPSVLFDVLKQSTANSTILNAKVPMYLSGDYSPAFRLELMSKDLGIVHAAARDAQMPLLLGGIVEQLYNASLEHKGKDSAAVSLLYQKICGVSLSE